MKVNNIAALKLILSIFNDSECLENKKIKTVRINIKGILKEKGTCDRNEQQLPLIYYSLMTPSPMRSP